MELSIAKDKRLATLLHDRIRQKKQGTLKKMHRRCTDEPNTCDSPARFPQGH